MKHSTTLQQRYHAIIRHRQQNVCGRCLVGCEYGTSSLTESGTKVFSSNGTSRPNAFLLAYLWEHTFWVSVDGFCSTILISAQTPSTCPNDLPVLAQVTFVLFAMHHCSPMSPTICKLDAVAPITHYSRFAAEVACSDLRWNPSSCFTHKYFSSCLPLPRRDRSSGTRLDVRLDAYTSTPMRLTSSRKLAAP